MTVLVTAAAALSDCLQSEPAHPAAVATSRALPALVRVDWSHPLAQYPAVIAYGDRAVWVAFVARSGKDHGRLLSFNPSTGAPHGRAIAVGWAPSGIAISGVGIWVADSIGDGSRPHGLQNAITRINPSTGRVVGIVRFPAVKAVAAVGRYVWATAQPTSGELLARIDPQTNRVVTRIHLPGTPGSIVAGGDKLWVLTWFSNPSQHARIYAVDPASGRILGVTTVRGGGPLSSLVYSRQHLWMTSVVTSGPSAGQGKVLRINTADGKFRTMTTPSAVDTISANASGILVAGNRLLSVLDTSSGHTRARLDLPAPVPEATQVLTASANRAWLLDGSRVLGLGTRDANRSAR